LTWPRLLEENFRKRRSYQFEICNRPYDEWAQLGDQPVIASGHQPELFHPGVWIKNVLVAEFASRLHAKHEMLVVDADAPTSFSIAYPVTQAGELTQRNHRLEGTTAAQPFECMPSSKYRRTASINIALTVSALQWRSSATLRRIISTITARWKTTSSPNGACLSYLSLKPPPS